MWLGAEAIAVVALLIGAMLLVKVADVGYRHYTARFLQAAALQVGNPITIAGIPVGEVTSMKLAGDHVEAGLKVQKDVALGQDSRATIKVTTILGSRYLALDPEGSGMLPDNTFELSHTEVPYDLQEALADVTTTYEQVDSDKFAQTLGILGTQLKGIPGVLPQALENTRTLSTIIADRRDQLGTLLQTTEQVSNTLRRQQSNIGSLINQGNDLIGEFVSRRESFHAMMAALTNLVQTLSGIVVDDRPELEKLLQNIRELSDMLGKHDDLLRSTLQAGPPALRGLANASGTGNAVDLHVSNGLLIDSWMCAISGRAKQFGMIEYYRDCK
jgi:virulence factor Mce-like protein